MILHFGCWSHLYSENNKTHTEYVGTLHKKSTTKPALVTTSTKQ